MPAYMEMLVSHSPPIYSHSPPTGFLTEFARQHHDTHRLYRPTTLSPKPLRKQFSLPIKMPASKKSILVVHNEQQETTDDIEVDRNNLKNKKRVVFADDQGFQLEQIKIMKEQSCEPPIWSLQFLAHVTQGLISPVPTEQWTLDFRQPASDYLTFRRQVEETNVSLENVIIKESESCVVGTVKVKNLGFEKEVLIRSSWDNWKSQTDTFCTYSKIASAAAGYTVYDTFSFKLVLPPNSRHLEFAVCYKANGQEYWDNNQGKNYILTNRHSPIHHSGHIKITLDSSPNSSPKKLNSTPIEIPHKNRHVLNRLSPWNELNMDINDENVNSTPYW